MNIQIVSDIIREEFGFSARGYEANLVTIERDSSVQLTVNVGVAA
jgi:hypothetical protein